MGLCLYILGWVKPLFLAFSSRQTTFLTFFVTIFFPGGSRSPSGSRPRLAPRFSGQPKTFPARFRSHRKDSTRHDIGQHRHIANANAGGNVPQAATLSYEILVESLSGWEQRLGRVSISSKSLRSDHCWRLQFNPRAEWADKTARCHKGKQHPKLDHLNIAEARNLKTSNQTPSDYQTFNV